MKRISGLGVLSLPFTSCVILEKSPNFSGFSYPLIEAIERVKIRFHSSKF